MMIFYIFFDEIYEYFKIFIKIYKIVIVNLRLFINKFTLKILVN